MLTKTLSEAKKKQRNILIKAMNNDIGSIDSSRDSWNPAQISERAKDISYIRSLVDTWNPAQLNEALRMLDLPVIDTWNPAQIEEQRRNLVFYLAERTLTGNPITLKILGNLTPEVTGLKVTMNPIQSGSGDPSPTNIRPIIGRTEASVTRTAGEDVETKTHQYSETIYGGVDDFLNGGATSNYAMVDISTLTWYKYTGSGFGSLYYSDSLMNVIESTDTTKIHTLCDIFKSVTNTGHDGQVGTDREQPDQSIRVNYIAGSQKRLYIRDEESATLADFQTKINGHQLCYELATPTTISTSAEEITLLKGENVLSTDGDSIELKYKQNF